MLWVIEQFAEPLAQGYFIKSMIGGCLVAIVAGVVGCLVVLRRMAFLGDALSHAMIAGVAGGYLIMKMVFGLEANAPGMLIGSLIAAIITVGLIGFVSRVSRVKEDTAIGIMYTGIFALGVVFVSIFRHYIHIDLMHFIMGDILGISDVDLWASTVVAAAVLTIIILFFRHFQIAAFDPVMAASIGLPIVLLDYLLTTCVSLVVVSAVSMVGVILVVGLLITPASTAYLLSDKLSKMMWLAAVFGVTSVVGGLYLAEFLDTAGGGAVMLFATVQFLAVLIVAPRYGLMARWWRLHIMVPQQVQEDVLVTLLRNNDQPMTADQLAQHMPKHQRLHRGLNLMVGQQLLEQTDTGYRLTDTGQQQANRILRAHRLWEAYLAHVGTPAAEIHKRAHALEHISRDETIDYLDQLLGHPKTDPHGKAIPLQNDPPQKHPDENQTTSTQHNG